MESSLIINFKKYEKYSDIEDYCCEAYTWNHFDLFAQVVCLSPAHPDNFHVYYSLTSPRISCLGLTN